MTAIRVLVVDDSVVVRRLVADVLGQDPAIEVVGTAVNGRAALAKVEQLRPDLITMDIEMPELDGVAAVRELRRLGDRTPIIMFSTLTERGAVATLDALSAGASDYVTKPANVGSVSQSMEQVRSSLVPKILALVPRGARGAAVPAPRSGALPPAARPALPTVQRPDAPVRLAARRRPPAGYDLLVVGCSTGGPEALTTFLSSLPPLRVPVAVVQHMPAVFTRQFAARLDRLLPFRVVEASDGLVLAPGDVAIAPGDFHLHLHRAGGRLVSRLTQDAPENYCRPAVDVLFRTAVAAQGAGVLAVVLTGMGQDGCAGARRSSTPAAACWRRTARRPSCGACPEPSPPPASPRRCCRSPRSAPPSPPGWHRPATRSAQGARREHRPRGLRLRARPRAARERHRPRHRQGVPGRVAPDPARPRGGCGRRRRLRRRPAAADDAPATRAVVEALTTNETSWFRDGDPFSTLRSTVLPDLATRRPARGLRIWSAACSSGQEPYSIAIALAETPAVAGWRIEVLGTDLSEEMVARARAGRYTQLEVNRGLPATSLVRHFERDGTHWRIAPALTAHVSFRTLNLVRPFPPLGRFDVVFLRNVLIYFDVATKRDILRRVRQVMAPDGYLFLGAAEMTMGVDDAWERVPAGRSSVYRIREEDR